MSKMHNLTLAVLSTMLFLTACTEEGKKEETVEVMTEKYPESKVEAVEIVKEEVEGEEVEVAVVEATIEEDTKTTTVIDTKTKEVKRTNTEIRKLSKTLQPIVDAAISARTNEYLAASFMDSGEGVYDAEGFAADFYIIHASDEEEMDLMYDTLDSIQATHPDVPFISQWHSYRLSPVDFKNYVEKYGREVNIEALRDYKVLNYYEEFVDLTDLG